MMVGGATHPSLAAPGITNGSPVPEPRLDQLTFALSSGTSSFFRWDHRATTCRAFGEVELKLPRGDAMRQDATAQAFLSASHPGPKEEGGS